MRGWVWLLAASIAVGACGSDTTGPQPGDTVGPNALHIARQAAAAPVLQAYSASFWAVRGQSRTLEIDYVDAEDFFRLDIPGDALLRRPDGSTILPGDSVLITVTIDSARVLFQFEPSGLVFDPNHPAKLRIDYGRADDDLDEDGDVDAGDDAIENTWLGVWRQGNTGANWVRLGTIHSSSLEEFEADLIGFSNYAMGW
jgi:hypothetical protein